MASRRAFSALRRADHTLDYYAANRWSGRLPEILQGLVADTLRAAGTYRTVQPEAAPFDTIILAAAAAHVPQALLQQLALGGRMLMPLGAAEQHLLLVERRAEGFVETRLDGVRFVPLLSGVE